ncbi:MAG: hypothetical protein WD739_06820, partial [Actinomycetota bacterium]
TVQQVAEPVTETVQQVAEPVTETVQQVADPVANAVNDALDDAVDQPVIGGSSGGEADVPGTQGGPIPAAEVPEIDGDGGSSDGRLNAASGRLVGVGGRTIALNDVTVESSLLSATTQSGAPLSSSLPSSDGPASAAQPFPFVGTNGSSSGASNGSWSGALMLIFAAVPAAVLLLANGSSRWFRLVSDARMPTPYVSFEERPG